MEQPPKSYLINKLGTNPITMPGKKQRKLHEADVKVALLNWHRTNGDFSDTCVISEMMANWRHRIDLVIVDDKVNAYEIKSDFDNLNRLRSQIRSFALRFDRLAVVCPPKFTEKVIKLVPAGVGVIEYIANEEDISFRIVQPYPITPEADKTAFISLLKKRQLEKFVRSKGWKFSGSKSKYYLASLAASLSWEELREAVVKVLKVRYSKTSKAFIESLRDDQPITTEDLSRLVKWKTFRRFRKNPEDQIVF